MVVVVIIVVVTLGRRIGWRVGTNDGSKVDVVIGFGNIVGFAVETNLNIGGPDGFTVGWVDGIALGNKVGFSVVPT